MSEGSNSINATSSADTAARLYPSGNGNQNQGGTQENSNNGSTEVATPYVVTNMTDGKTVYFDPNTGESFEMETRNAVAKKSKGGADDPYNGRITGVVYPEGDDNKKKFGWAMVTTDDERHRWIHGGGSGLDDPYAARQGWVPTLGCTRGQNEDMHQLAQRVEQFQKNNPNVPIMYYRVRPE